MIKVNKKLIEQLVKEELAKVLKESEDNFDAKTGLPSNQKGIELMMKSRPEEFRQQVVKPIYEYFDKLGDQHGMVVSNLLVAGFQLAFQKGGDKANQLIWETFKIAADIPEDPEAKPSEKPSDMEGLKQALKQFNSMIKSAERAGRKDMVDTLKKKKMEYIQSTRK